MMARVNPTPFAISVFAGLAFGWAVAFWVLIGLIAVAITLEATDR